MIFSIFQNQKNTGCSKKTEQIKKNLKNLGIPPPIIDIFSVMRHNTHIKIIHQNIWVLDSLRGSNFFLPKALLFI